MKFLIFKNEKIDKSNSVIKKFLSVIKTNKINYEIVNIDSIKTIKKEIIKKYDFAVIFGGDGTIISASRVLKNSDIPIIGINLGHLGFLTSIEKNENFDKYIKKIINGKYYIDERNLIESKLVRNNKIILNETSLNETTVACNFFYQMGKYDVYFNNVFFNNYNADGLILASVTGATGHSLSAGGPIIEAGVNAFVFTAICPHAMNTRSIIIKDDTIIKFVIKSQNQVLDFDGAVQKKLLFDDEVIIEKSNKTMKFINFDESNLFNNIKNKIKSF